MSLNPISFRLPTFDLSTPEGQEAAHRYVASGIVDLNQAIAALKQQQTGIQTTIKTVQQSLPSTSSGVTSFNTHAGNVTFFPQLGMVNDQLGNPSYLTQATDNGQKIIVGDSAPVTVNLDAGVPVPWFAVIDNDSSATATLTPTSGVVNGAQAIAPGGFGIVFFDGADFWCGATSGGATGTIPLGPLTDSGMTGSIDVENGLIISWVSPS